MGSGAKVPNDGQVNLSLQTGGDLLNDIISILQFAKVSRRLMSVGKLCDAGMDVNFKKDRAHVIAALSRDSPAGCTWLSSSSKDQRHFLQAGMSTVISAASTLLRSSFQVPRSEGSGLGAVGGERMGDDTQEASLLAR